jgi:D-alanyl-D-alanine carboxypeptidase
LDKSVINPDVTIEQLLTMTSGIEHVQDYYRQEVSDLQGSSNWRPVDVVGLVILDFVPPGTYSYSNTNTFLLGLIAEHKGGQRLNELYKSELLDPLDLVALLLPQDNAPSNTARPYDDLSSYGGTGFGDISEASYFADWYQATGKTAWAAAGMITTPENLARWAYELFSEKGSGISSAARTSLMNSFTGPLVEIGPKKQQYGYHAAKRTVELSGSAITVYGHPGSGGGFVSDVYYSPELDISISLVINSHSGARTRAEAQGKLGHSDLDEIAQKIFDAISLVR